ncbi:MAG TPA: hypothetical protein PLH57_10640, partial [Oligoflexia bacterium]|nr:hypothetical protein [Oligoflexia bacterium]
MDILGQSALLVAVAACSLAFKALSKKLRNSLVVQYAVLCFVISAWALTFFLEKIFLSGFCYQLHLGFNVILTPVALRFVRSITRTSTRYTQIYDLAAAIYGAIVLLVLWLGIIEGSFFKILATYAPSFLFFECVRLMLLDLRRIRARTKDAEPIFLTQSLRNTLRSSRRVWIYIGALVLLATAVMDHVPQLGEVIPSIGNGLLCIYLYVFSEAIIHQRLFNRTALVSRVIVLVFTSAVCSGIFSAFLGWIEQEPALFILNAFVASVLFLIVLEPIRSLAHWVATKVSGRGDRVIQDKVRRAEAVLSGAVDSIGLAHSVLSFLEEVFVVRSASVFVLRSDESKYRRIRGLRDDSLMHTEVLASHAVVEFFSRLRRRGETPIVLENYLENEIE